MPISLPLEVSEMFVPAMVDLAPPVMAPPAEIVVEVVEALPMLAPTLTAEVAPVPDSEIVVPVMAPLMTTAFCARAPPEIEIIEPAAPVMVLLTVATPVLAVTVISVPDNLPGVVTLSVALRVMLAEFMEAVLLNNRLPVDVRLTFVDGVPDVPSVPFICTSPPPVLLTVIVGAVSVPPIVTAVFPAVAFPLTDIEVPAVILLLTEAVPLVAVTVTPLPARLPLPATLTLFAAVRPTAPDASIAPAPVRFMLLPELRVTVVAGVPEVPSAALTCISPAPVLVALI